MTRTVQAVAVVAGALMLIAAMVGDASASPIVVPLVPEDYADLGVTGEASVLVVSHYDYGGVFTGDVMSQAFTLAGGDYLYLYQADNDGPSVLEVLAVCPFYHISAAGWLTAGEPTGFLVGGIAPLGMTYDADLVKPNISYNYPSFLGGHVPAGQHTKALYVISPNSPTMGEAYVIDAGTYVVEAVTSIPEPATLGLLALGVGGLVAARRRGRRGRRAAP